VCVGFPVRELKSQLDSRGRFRMILRGSQPKGSGVYTNCGIRAQNKSFISVAERRGELYNHAAEKKRHTNV
jgi:hypothetical protein